MVYDEIHGYALTATNPFFDDSSPKDHVFVDEFSCIGTFFYFLSFHILFFDCSSFNKNCFKFKLWVFACINSSRICCL